MSGIVVGLVLRTPISDIFNSEAKFIATVYADHAWEDGTHAYPAVETVANITGLSDRTVQRYLRLLVSIGMLIPDGKGPRGTNQYRFPLESGQDGSVRLALQGGDRLSPPAKEQKPADSGDTQSPRQPVTGDTDSGDRESGDSIVSPEPTNRPLNTQEEEEKAAPNFQISAQLQEELKELGIFVSVWKDVEKQITGGWTEADIVALIDWNVDTRKDKAKAARSFVTRVREGTKAPREYYKFNQRRVSGKWYPGNSEESFEPAASQDESNPILLVNADNTVTVRIGERMTFEQAWQSVLGQLQTEMPRTSFDTWVRDTIPVHFEDNVLQIAVRNSYARDWLESRLKSTMQRLLIGIVSLNIEVEFVVAQSVAVETEVEE